jgi:hypothetical protein
MLVGLRSVWWADLVWSGLVAYGSLRIGLWRVAGLLWLAIGLRWIARLLRIAWLLWIAISVRSQKVSY